MACSTVVRCRNTFVAYATFCLTPSTVSAQHIEPHAAAFWVSRAALMGAAVPADEWVRSVATRLPLDRLDGITRLVEPIGRPEYLVPALVTTYAVARGIDKRRFADATLRTA